MKKLLALLLLVSGLLLVSCGGSPAATPEATPTEAPTETPTVAPAKVPTVALPTPAPRKIPTQVSYLVPAQGQPHLGGSLSAFYSAFAGAHDGGPDADGVTHDYSFYDPRVSGPNGPVAYISIAASGKTVVDILIDFPHGWTPDNYLTYTKEFLPPDAAQGSTSTRYNGVTIQYTSQIAGPFSLSMAYGVPDGSLDTPAFQ